MFLPFPQWVDQLADSELAVVACYARENPIFCHNLDVAQAVGPLRPVLVEEAVHWRLGEVLRAILQDERDYWSWVANPTGRRRRTR